MSRIAASSALVLCTYALATSAQTSSTGAPETTKAREHITNIADECRTIADSASGVASGSYCAVPFYYDDELRYAAIMINGVLSCPVEVGRFDRAIESEDDIAPAECHAVRCMTKQTNVTGIEEGLPCAFPFYENRILRRSCVTDDVWGQPPWCPIAVDENYDYEYKQWGYCECVDASLTTQAPVTTAPSPPPQDHHPDPGPDPGRGGSSGDGSNSVDASAIAIAVFATMLSMSLLLLGVVAYRRGMFRVLRDKWQSASWYRDLAPEGFRYSPIRDRVVPPAEEDDMEDIRLDPGNANDYGTLGHKNSGETVVDMYQQSSASGGNTEAIDWDAMEAAAAKLRTCHVSKVGGQKIGLKILNYQGPNYAGARIVAVTPGSAGDIAGMAEGDSIVEIANQPIINLYHQEVVDLLIHAGNEFDVIVCRD